VKGDQKKISIIILAAGSSSRMGRSKQLLEVKGEQLLLRAVQTALGTGVEKIIVVLGANEPAHRKIIEHLQVDVITNPEWEKGMGSSLKKGLVHLLETTPQIEAALIMVCDQPLLTSGHLNKLINTAATNTNGIIASYYANGPGVPVLFIKSLFKSLLSIADQEGAKLILQKNKGEITSIEFPGGETDLDTWSDYEKFISTNIPKK
jgi:molybdenum cofactor cytidylyltransferase